MQKTQQTVQGDLALCPGLYKAPGRLVAVWALAAGPVHDLAGAPGSIARDASGWPEMAPGEEDLSYLDASGLDASGPNRFAC
jgi:hypothetical protein